MDEIGILHFNDVMGCGPTTTTFALRKSRQVQIDSKGINLRPNHAPVTISAVSDICQFKCKYLTGKTSTNCATDSFQFCICGDKVEIEFLN